MQSLCCEQCSRTKGIREATSITNTTVLHDVKELGPVEKVCRRNRGSEGIPICIACHCEQRNNYNISSHLHNNMEKSGEHHEHRLTWVPYRCYTDVRQRRAMRKTIFCAKLLRAHAGTHTRCWTDVRQSRAMRETRFCTKLSCAYAGIHTHSAISMLSASSIIRSSSCSISSGT